MCLISKWSLLLIILLSFAGCSEESPIEELRWLEGNWKQVNQKGSRLSLESWIYINGELIGNGYTVDYSSGQYDTLFKEDIRIILREQKLFYEADLPNQPPVLFRMTEKKEDGWTFANPQHDFPKYIQYQKTQSGFSAIVGDGNRESKLDFQKL